MPLGALLRALVRRQETAEFVSSWGPGSSCYPVISGVAALTLALKSLKQCSVRVEVVLPAYTCPSVLMAIVKAGLKPVLCDMDRCGFGMDLDDLSRVVGPRTLAVVAVHLYGIPERIHAIRGITAPQNVFLVEDAAQAFGNRSTADNGGTPCHDRKRQRAAYMGSLGDLAVWSFGRGKPLTLLSGGMVVVNRPDLDRPVQAVYHRLGTPPGGWFRLRYVANLLAYALLYHPRAYWLPEAMPWLHLGETIFTLDFPVCRMGPLVLSLGNIAAQDFERVRSIRQALGRRYAQQMLALGDQFDFLPDGSLEGLALLRFPLLFRSGARRDEVLGRLRDRGLGATASYPHALNEQPGTAPYLKTSEGFTNARAIAHRVMTLPLHPLVSDRDIDDIVDVLRS